MPQATSSSEFGDGLDGPRCFSTRVTSACVTKSMSDLEVSSDILNSKHASTRCGRFYGFSLEGSPSHKNMDLRKRSPPVWLNPLNCESRRGLMKMSLLRA